MIAALATESASPYSVLIAKMEESEEASSTPEAESDGGTAFRLPVGRLAI